MIAALLVPVFIAADLIIVATTGRLVMAGSYATYEYIAENTGDGKTAYQSELDQCKAINKAVNIYVKERYNFASSYCDGERKTPILTGDAKGLSYNKLVQDMSDYYEVEITISSRTKGISREQHLANKAAAAVYKPKVDQRMCAFSKQNGGVIDPACSGRSFKTRNDYHQARNAAHRQWLCDFRRKNGLPPC